MANASKKHGGPGAQRGKGSGSGARSEIVKDQVAENMVLSNRDKKQHTRERGQDGKSIRTEQRPGRHPV